MSQKEEKPNKIDILHGRILRRIRVSKGWSQEGAAKEYGCSVRTWARWEQGKWPQGATGERLRMVLTDLFKLPKNPFMDKKEDLPSDAEWRERFKAELEVRTREYVDRAIDETFEKLLPERKQ